MFHLYYQKPHHKHNEECTWVDGYRPSEIIEIESYASVKVSYSVYYGRIVVRLRGINNMANIAESESLPTFSIRAA